jgi:anti-sigma regulatory factor (Ser/Thr protein kinase)
MMTNYTIQEFKPGAATGAKELLEARVVASSESGERGSLCVIIEDQGDWHQDIKEVWYCGRKYKLVECPPEWAFADNESKE